MDDDSKSACLTNGARSTAASESADEDSDHVVNGNGAPVKGWKFMSCSHIVRVVSASKLAPD